jgi:putative hydrolase of the HAD superfamily
MQKPEVIFFDAVGTLFDVQGTVGEIYGEFAQQAGITVDPRKLNQAFIQSFRTAPRPAFVERDPVALGQLEYEWWRAVAFRSFEKVGAHLEIENFDTFFGPVFDHFASADPWFVYPEVPEALAALKSLGIELAIISNFDTRLYLVLHALELNQWFSSITLSTQIGTAKPDPGIFQAALAIYGHSPDKTWHVGDSWTEDYQGAIGAGIQGIWLDRHSTQDLPAKIIIDTLSALLQQLESEGETEQQGGKQNNR